MFFSQYRYHNESHKFTTSQRSKTKSDCFAAKSHLSSISFPQQLLVIINICRPPIQSLNVQDPVQFCLIQPIHVHLALAMCQLLCWDSELKRREITLVFQESTFPYEYREADNIIKPCNECKDRVDPESCGSGKVKHGRNTRKALPGLP